MMRRLRDERGIGLLEMAVAVALLLVVTTAAVVVMTSGYRTERAGRARADAMSDVRLALDRMTKEVRQALFVEDSSTKTRLEMRTLLGGAEHVVVYDVAGDVLRREVDGGGPEPLARGVTSAQIFCYDPPDCVEAGPGSSAPTLLQVSITAAPRHFAGEAVVAVTTDVHLRNLD